MFFLFILFVSFTYYNITYTYLLVFLYNNIPIEIILEGIEYLKVDRNLEHEMDDHDKKMKEYHKVDNIINL